MAAGLGFKTFATGEVLTAGDTNGYLMQGVLVFANAAARTSAITSPQEGQMSYLKDTNSTEYYSGSAWIAVSGASGGMTLISEVVASANSSIDFTSISGSYKQLMLVWNGIYHSAVGSIFSIRFNSDAGSNYEDIWIAQNPSTGNIIRGGVGNNSYILSANNNLSCFGQSVDNVDTNYSVGWLLIDNYASTSKYKNYTGNWNYQESGMGMWTVYNDMGVYTSTSAITSLNIFRVSGAQTMSNVANTSVRLYGIS